MNVEKTITQYIIGNFMLDGDSERLGNDQSFLESGIIDSTGILELVSFIEEHFAIKIEDEELIPENLDSIRNIVTFVTKKLHQGSMADARP